MGGLGSHCELLVCVWGGVVTTGRWLEQSLNPVSDTALPFPICVPWARFPSC